MSVSEIFDRRFPMVFPARITSSSPTVYPMLFKEQVLVGGVLTDMPGGRIVTTVAGSASVNGAFTADGLGWKSDTHGFIIARRSNDNTSFNYLFQPFIPTPPPTSATSTFVLISQAGVLTYRGLGSCP